MIHQLVEEADFEMGEEAAILFSALDPTGSPPAQPDHVCRRKKNVPAARVRASDIRTPMASASHFSIEEDPINSSNGFKSEPAKSFAVT
jgi:hypothetical protein